MISSSATLDDSPQTSMEGLAFLVTHWLANLDHDRNNQDDVDRGRIPVEGDRGNDTDQYEEQQQQRRQAVERIRIATTELASAFSVLGAFGTTLPPSLSGSSSVPRNATYSDARRRWNNILPSHLEHLAQAVASTNGVVDATFTTPVNLLDAVTEDRDNATTNRGTGSWHPNGPAATHESMTVGDDEGTPAHTDMEASQQTGKLNILSIMQPPSRIAVDNSPSTKTRPDLSGGDAEGLVATVPLMAQSSFVEVGQLMAESMRRLLELRGKVQVGRQEIENAKRSIEFQMGRVQVLDARYRELAVEGVSVTKMLEVTEEVKNGKKESERIMAQLERKLGDLTLALSADEVARLQLEKEVKVLDERQKSVTRTRRDPYWSWAGKVAPNNHIGAYSILRTVLGRQTGLSRPRNDLFPPQSSILSGQKTTHFIATRKALLSGRFSHAATINAHIMYPVYCLRFDRTGRYFISGADDYLVKVFHLGSGQSCRNKNPRDGSRLLRTNYGANLRGAILVCSLRGHAGVINDIDVSSDNALLATASVDGDVRVWGLKDGSPIAILRGHKGGANMVSWSKLTPYRLVSTGGDGFARIWDIREACLQRYIAQVGKRPEYRLKLMPNEKSMLQDLMGTVVATPDHLSAPLPAIPARQPSLPAAEGTDEGIGNTGPNPPSVEELLGLVVPPLPDAVPPLPGNMELGNAVGNDPENGGAEIPPPGQFVANDDIDEGVKLLRKFKHGSTGPEVVGPGTRARRATVNVICVARCPLGLYFATGSDDGICRVFADDEELGVAIVDQRSSTEEPTSLSFLKNRSSRSERNEPVLKLKGHVSAITDLSYSHAGDRILSASQKDGVVRIWTLGRPVLDKKAESGISQIVMKLVDPGNLSSRSEPQTNRRLPGGSNRNDASNVSCDVAVWTHDDAKVITSQSVLVKQSGSDIQPGSQYIFLWDSRSGHCLLGISGAHTRQCPVVVPHPLDSTLICTAGADGMAKVWDWQTGRCIFSHSNKVEFGPMESSETAKIAGYLDGSFNADGTTLVLTDDSGRLTIFGSMAEDDDVGKRNSSPWMREQYFANDYYDLVYDRTGYCIERGSERPPHLAPRGVRCDHTGTPWPDGANEAFSRIVGPSPLSETVCRWQRDEMRRQAFAAVQKVHETSDSQAVKTPRGMREFDPATTILIKGPGAKDIVERHRTRGTVEDARSATVQQSVRNESENWRYLDYDDMIRLQGNQDDEEPDSDDEEFSPTVRNRENSGHSDDSENDDMDLDDLEDLHMESPSRRSRNREVQHSAREQRSRRRAQPRDIQFLEIGSEDEVDDQIMSTNNVPSGRFVADYVEKGHFWRMPSGNVRSMWLKRLESTTSYEGRKIYTPQLGDSVVYIPRAHYETLKKFPSLEPPWQYWPQGTAWPVVRCCVRGVRFRFPYQDYYRSSNHRSIVAILILEVTGIPELSRNREFPWPKPLFVESTTAFVFELSLFESNDCEYVFPEGLYEERLMALEVALRNRRQPRGLGVSAYFAPERGREDAEMESSAGQIQTLIPEEESSSDPHMVGSGFGVVRVDFGDSWADDFSPWDLCMPDLSISRPQLSEEDKKLVLEKLDVQCQKNEIAQHFNLGVDTIRYCDYERMVEVEMFLMIVKRRLGKDYYGSKFAVVQDLRQIRDNCMKYNGSDHELVEIATRMCQEFESSLLTEEETLFLKESDSLTLSRDRTPEPHRRLTIRINLRQRTSQVSAHQHQQTQGHSSREARSQGQSSLENLPSPAVERRVQPSRRGRARAAEASLSQPNGVPNNGRSLRPRNGANLESLSRLGEGTTARLDPNESRSSRYARRHAAGDTVNQGSAVGIPADEHVVAVPAVASRRSATSTSQRAEVAVVSRSQRATRSNRASARSARNEEVSVDEEELQPRSTTRATRSSPRKKNRIESEEEAEEENSSSDSDEPMENDESDGTDESPVRRGSRRAAAGSRARAKRSTEAKSTRPSRASSRAGARRNASYEDPSDFEPEDSDAEEVSDQEEEEEEEEEVIQSPNARKRKIKSYAEIPSDFDEEEEESSDDEPRSRKPPTQKRKRAAVTPRTSPAKKKKEEGPMEQISLKTWPNIPLKDITRISKAVLAKVSSEDTDGHFSIPVLEAYPFLAADYLEFVKDPMDFRTIEEERIPQYKRIKDLQTDLLLIFDNCCQFNGTDTEMGQYAIKIRNQVNDFFSTACTEKNVSIGRWRPY